MRVMLLVAAMATACGGGGDDDAGEQACRDFCDALADTFERCGADYTQTYNDCVQGAANGDCANVQGLRDADEFYDECIPWIRSEACAQIAAPGWTIDSSCEGQLLR